ncbi:MAG: type B 50S ribosomal protein L31 [Candidatus Omnitrophica bacterium]|nr:type B 50S ribosomal protein L31 [Candidatus Omnitrophota bacterium]
MKDGIHPKGGPVVFHDVSCGEKFMIWSTVKADKKIKWEDGKEYPLIDVDISSASHPFYTGQDHMIDTAGRVERFRKREQAARSKQKKLKPQKEAVAEASPAPETEAPKEEQG